MKSILPYFIMVFLLMNTIVTYSQTTRVDSTGLKFRTYKTVRTASVPVIDGKLNDACWQNNNWSGDFIQWIPNEGAKPSQPTFINILYDDKNLYVAIRAYDSEPEKMIRKAGRRDEISGDVVGINIDSYHDHRTGFEFNATSAGQKADLLLTNPMNGDFSWDAVWNVKVGTEDSAWVVEYEIPLSQLRYSHEKEQTWGLHVWRWIDRLQEESDWEPQTSTGPGMLYQFGHLEGIVDLPKSRRIELMPYVSGKISTFEKEALNPFQKNGYRLFGNIGLDAKIGITSNFTADVTINPDFGQVESDPSEMNLSAFETFYEEKRPFFLEGKNIFSYEFDGLNLFYSRRVGQSPSYTPELGDNEYLQYPDKTSILSALKVSGKSSNGFSMGILQSITNKEMALISDGNGERKEAVEPLTSYTVARFQQDFNAGNTVLGGIITSTNRLDSDPHFDFLNQNALTGGIDFLHQWHDKEFYLNAKIAGSNITGDPVAIKRLQTSSARYFQRPDAAHLSIDETLTQLSGHGGKIQIGKGSKGHWRYSTSVSWLSPGLELNDLGYMQLADQVKNTNEVSYFITQPKGVLRSFNASLGNNNYWDYAFNFLNSHFVSSVSGQFLNKWSVNGHVCHFPEATDTRILRGGYSMKIPTKTHGQVKVSSDYSRKVAFTVTSFLEKGGESTSTHWNIEPSLTVQPITILKFSFSANYSENHNELQYVTALEPTTDARYILGKIDQQTFTATIKVDYHITPELSFQYYGSPFFTVGNFSNFKWVNNPLADQYNDRFEQLNATLSDQNEYSTSDGMGFDNPDFSFTQFRSNLVFRWEYMPGSKLFVVWANEKTLYQQMAGVKLDDAFTGFGKAISNNIFLIKLNYWFTL
jgi:hypothetical protein